MKTCITGVSRLLLFLLALAAPSDCLSQCCPPVITVQPQPQTVNQGQLAIFSVTVSSSTSVTYTWYRNGTFLSSGTSSTYSIASTTTNDVGTYVVAVTNASPGGTNSDGNATLTVHVKPYIVTQPASQTKLYTSNVTFSVVAGPGSPQPPLSYQWRFNGANLPGKTGTSCTVTNLQLTNAGNYAVVVNNPYGSVTSAVAGLTVTYINLTPSQFPGWSDKLIVTTATNTVIDSSPLRTTNVLYARFSILNNGTASTGTGFTNEVYLDDVLLFTATSGTLLNNTFAQSGYLPLGMLTEGPHTVRIKADSSNKINELDENDNEYTKLITVIGNPPLVLTANGFTSNGGFKIVITGPPFATFVIETSVGLVNWNNHATNTLNAGGSFNYTDGNAPNFNHRYYRARLQ